jgi:hypothetical protein
MFLVSLRSCLAQASGFSEEPPLPAVWTKAGCLPACGVRDRRVGARPWSMGWTQIAFDLRILRKVMSADTRVRCESRPDRSGTSNPLWSLRAVCWPRSRGGWCLKMDAGQPETEGCVGRVRPTKRSMERRGSARTEHISCDCES